jgi:hypothetical protein
MRKTILRTTAAVAVMCAGLVGAPKPAAASGTATHGWVFVHGTGDYPVAGQTTVSTTLSQSVFPCVATPNGGVGTSCYAPAAYGGSNYWEANEIAAITNGDPFVVVGYNGGSCAPWPLGASNENVPDQADGTYAYTSTAKRCPLPSSVGNADIIAGQVIQFMNNNPGMNQLQWVTHSGGSNLARYIFNNYTRNTNFGTLWDDTWMVVTLAGTTEGTYLANEVFASAIPGADLVAGLVGYGGEGVNMLRTTNIGTYNTSTSYLGAIANPLNYVYFYASGGVSTNVCFGAYFWGTCWGVTGPTLGILPSGSHTDFSVTGNSCDSELDDLGLLALNDLFMNKNDSSTYRNSCSDGFISCQGAQSLGTTFSFSGGQDHNQSRRTCNNLPQNIHSEVNYFWENVSDNPDPNGFEYSAQSFNVSPVQLDACGFHDYACIVASQDDWNNNGCSNALAWTEGCQLSQLGNGQCDWDCVALYGNDAVVTSWSDAPNNTIPLTWAAGGDCAADAGAAPSSPLPFAENYPQNYDGGGVDAASLVAFNGYSVTGTISGTLNGYSCSGTYPNQTCGNSNTGYCNPATVTPASACYNIGITSPSGGQPQAGGYYVDPNFGQIEVTTGKSSGSSNGPGYYGAGYCPQSWIGDGTCDECVLALYGADGMDCAPGHIAQCGGILETVQPYYQGSSGESVYYANNKIYNESMANSGGKWLLWQSMPAANNDGVCEETECQQGWVTAVGMTSSSGYTATPTTSGTPCTSGSQCPGMLTCGSNGYCTSCTGNANNASGSCNSSTWGWSGGVCNTGTGQCFAAWSISAQCAQNSDCMNGASCVNGGCTTASSDCSATYNGTATSLCR